MPVAAERDGVRMLDDKELVGKLAALALFDESTLQFEGFAVIQAAQIAPAAAKH